MPHSEIPQANVEPKPISQSPADTFSGEGPWIDDAHISSALVGNLTEAYRRRVDLMRAMQRLDLQAQAVCRRYVEGDKVAAAKLWRQVKKRGHPLALVLEPFIAAIEVLEGPRLQTEKDIERMAKRLPVWSWVEGVKGFGALSFGAVVGECAAPLCDFKSPAAVWKRMGLAVIAGGRQRRVAGEQALEHGYSAQRRSIMWNVGDSLIKAQVRAVKDEEGKKVGDSYAIGEYGALYLERKAYEAGRVETAGHAHNRAKRYIEKRLLRDMWREWRRERDDDPSV